MTPSIRLLDAAVAAWTLVWVVAGVLVYAHVRQLEDVGDTVVAAGDGLAETSVGLRSLAEGLRDTGRALDALDAIPFVDRIDNRLDVAAAETDRVALRVRQAARQARATGAETRASAQPLAVVLALAVAVAPTLPSVVLYLLLRPLVVERLRAPA